MDAPDLASLGQLESSSGMKIRADGQPTQKRGPKPRNQPALTRKQELARKAQRNHRERKEVYVQALEQEILLLKNDSSSLSLRNDNLELENGQLKERIHALSGRNTTLEEENWQLRQALENLGISWPGTNHFGGLVDQVMPDHRSQIVESTPMASEVTTASFSNYDSNHDLSTSGENSKSDIDFDQLGIEFVLAIERPCLSHLKVHPEGELYGHVLMASCTPDNYPELGPLSTPLSSGHSSVSEVHALTKSQFRRLLERSQQLDLDGEVTPVMVWDMIRNHQNFAELRTIDFEKIVEEFSGRVSCYEFGAVLEEFEAREIIESHLTHRPRMEVTLEGDGNWNIR